MLCKSTFAVAGVIGNRLDSAAENNLDDNPEVDSFPPQYHRLSSPGPKMHSPKRLSSGKALIGSVGVGSSYEKLPSTLTQTEPIGQQVTSSGQLEFGDPKVIKKG